MWDVDVCKDSVECPFPILQLPMEVVILILQCVEAKELICVSETCKDLYRMCNYNIVWKRVCKKKWGVNKNGPLKKSLKSWKTYYAQKVYLEKSDLCSWFEINPTGELPSKRYQHTASVIGKHIYIIGGQELPERRFDEIYRMDTESSEIVRITPTRGTPPRSARHTSVTIFNKIFMFGGFDGVSQHFGLNVFDVETNEWYVPQSYGDVPLSRTNHASASIGHRMYIFGGMYRNQTETLIFLNDFYVLDTITMVWTKLNPQGPLPDSRCGHRLVSFGNKLLLFGGGSGEHWDKKYNDVYIYDPQLNVWVKPNIVGSAPVCTFTIPFISGPFLFLFGGQNYSDNSLTNDLYILDTISWTWAKVIANNNYPTQRDMGTGSVVGNSMYMFGGYCGVAVDNFYMLKINEKLSSPFGSSSLSPSQ
eukprot:TRINITY_DN645_c0_g2_i1.p1 TRINITY_DN645_c0_g2~~TRINITY_DN645_c0_g2_i1.p1  ORF type:complete len:435 (-),score=42.07 TRINITY_DN645_c0_g2_i1:46-1305(-)